MALAVARRHVLYLMRPGGQSQFSAHLAPRRNFRKASSRRCCAGFPSMSARALDVETLAARANMSARNFARAFVAETGETPARYVERARLDAARPSAHGLGSCRSPRSPPAPASARKSACAAPSSAILPSAPPPFARASSHRREFMTMKTIGILVFDDAEELDFVGPWEVFTMAKAVDAAAHKVILIAEEDRPIRCAKGLRVLPDVTTADCPEARRAAGPGRAGHPPRGRECRRCSPGSRRRRRAANGSHRSARARCC